MTATMYFSPGRAKPVNVSLGGMANSRFNAALCYRAQRQATAAFCYAVLHNIPMAILNLR